MVRRASVGSGFSLAKQITKRIQLVIGDFKKTIVSRGKHEFPPLAPVSLLQASFFCYPGEDFSYSAIGAPGSPYGSQK